MRHRTLFVLQDISLLGVRYLTQRRLGIRETTQMSKGGFLQVTYQILPLLLILWFFCSSTIKMQLSKLPFPWYQLGQEKNLWFRLPDLSLIFTPYPKLFFSKFWSWKRIAQKFFVLLFFPTSEFEEKIHIKMTIWNGNLVEVKWLKLG